MSEESFEIGIVSGLTTCSLKKARQMMMRFVFQIFITVSILVIPINIIGQEIKLFSIENNTINPFFDNICRSN